MPLKLLVISDSHGNYSRIDSIIKKESPLDYIIHCGDGVTDLFHVSIPDSVRIIKVRGNVDRFRVNSIGDSELEKVGGKTCLVVHGDKFGVNRDLDIIYKAAREANADIVFFGHTHVPLFRKGSPVLFNPGTVSKGAYGIVTLNAAMNFEHKYADSD